jgi:hypothetical protein
LNPPTPKLLHLGNLMIYMVIAEAWKWRLEGCLQTIQLKIHSSYIARTNPTSEPIATYTAVSYR